MVEFSNPAPCDIMLDLDCDNSNSIIDYSCLDIYGVPITDEDIRLFADDWLTEMTITIAAPIPNAPDEILEMTGSIPNIDVIGSGTSMIILTNAGGATIQDFKDALQLIVYKNLDLNPTAGIRIIEVQFTTALGTMSDIAEYHINVDDLGSLAVDLGPDQEICDDNSVTLDAGNPGATFSWSTGDNTQMITVTESGEYIITVSDGVLCPGVDTVIIDVIPVIHVSLSGDTDICDNEEATLTITTDSPFPLSVTIEADPGSPFVYSGITGTYTFTDLPIVTTAYSITEVIPDQPGCIELSDPAQIIEVFPTYIQEQEVSLCDGDSIWLGFYWETEAGVYENHLETIYGCDSIVTTYLIILPAVMIQQQSTTCDPSQAGVFVVHLDNPTGCDTVVTTTVTLLSADTTLLNMVSCALSMVGVTQDTSVGSDGCDSLIITSTSYIPPADTTFLIATSCDSSQLGLVQNTFTASDGCDSVVIITTTFSLIDTTYIFGTSCDSSALGMSQDTFVGMDGCDSLVIMTTAFGQPDTTLLFQTSCDSADLGVLQNVLTGDDGCDSLIITTVTFSAKDSTFIHSSTCNPAETGVFVTLLTNQNGCDSIVTETVTLLTSDTVAFNSSTCDPSMAGVFVTTLSNQYGCDSTITETVSLLPSDQVLLTSSTCNAASAGVFVTTLSNQYGCDSVITETVTLIPGDTTHLIAETCDPFQVGEIHNIIAGTDGCDSLIILTTSLYPLLTLKIQSVIDYNGYDISCAGESDASAMANVNGVSPFTYLWSTNEPDPLITGLAAGNYAVTVTDGNGCITDGEITLTEPALFMIAFELSEPDCFDQQVGSITVRASGGVAPYTYTIDGTAFQSSPDFTGLGEGIYQITSLDANDCIATEIIAIDVPLTVQVELGDNQVIPIGDSIQLHAVVNLPFDSLSTIMWTGIDNIHCPNCLTQIVAPVITTAYTVSVTSVDGCPDRDSVWVSVTTDQQVYIPNIFSPNGDGVNDVLQISVGKGIEEIVSFEIFDRWGTLVFGAEHILPNDPTLSWDGRMKEETMNPGVFTYKAIIVYTSGEREVKYGDITLIR